GVADDPAYDLGQGAGFYVDATQAPWAPHFRMETYVTRDLLAAVEAALPLDPARRGISGHSMGGHGALTLALRHPDLFRSVSAFAPIVSPTRCPWGEKAFSAYLGEDRAAWAQHDASLLISGGAANGHYDDILIDQGTADSFLEGQLKPQLFAQACAEAGQKLTLRLQEGYDHSYFFMASFIADHIDWHARRLKTA
ncbi:MAG TPA: S-formylglutathione hydrolase, partial [Phenylobacterium sp.]|nr:S-formylglutathione hydrolase [Phenylobacterium sp.]